MKSKYFEKQSARINQKIKVLINRPDFQADISFLRDKWNIPKDGIKTEKDNENWNDWILAETDDYYDKNWAKDIKIMSDLRKVEKYDEADAIKKKINRSAPLNAFNDDIWVVIRNYGLTPKWHGGLKSYLLSNNPDQLKSQTGLTVSFNWDHGMLRPSIEFDADTRIEDLKRAWTWARKLLKKNKNSKFQPIKNFERDKRIYELDKEGKTVEDIGEIIQTEFNEDLDYNHINIVLGRYKKRVHIN